MKKIVLFLFLACSGLVNTQAQELNCKVAINTSQIQGTNTQVFEALQNALNEFINGKEWTSAKYSVVERINCSLTLTVKEYTDDGHFTGELTIQSSRPVYNANYNTTIFNFKDPSITFEYMDQDQLQFNMNTIDNNLTAVIAYYAYLIIGLDGDTMSPLGGTDALQKVENIVAAAQTLPDTGWKAFDDSKNRHAIITDYMDEKMVPLRQLMYSYHRLGLDQMVQNAGRGRTAVTESLQLLKTAKENNMMSAIPQLFTDIKKEELINIYSEGTTNEKEQVFTLLQEINPAQTSEWTKIKR